MTRATFRICYLPGRRFCNGRSQPHRLQRRIAWFFWREIGWFEYVEDAMHCMAGEVRRRSERSNPGHTVTFDAEGLELL